MTDSLPSAAIFVSSRSFLSRLLLAWRDENGCEGNYMAVRQQSYLATIKYELQYFILRPIKNINLIFLSHGSKVHQKNNRGPANMSEKNKKKGDMYDFRLCMTALRNKMAADTFLQSFDNTRGCLCQERLLKFRNFATIVAWRHTSLYWFSLVPSRPRGKFDENAHNIEGSLADLRGASLDPLDIMTNLIQGSYKTYNNFSRTFQGPH